MYDFYLSGFGNYYNKSSVRKLINKYEKDYFFVNNIISIKFIFHTM